MNNDKALAIEQVLVGGDLSKLTVEQRVAYHDQVCESLGLNKLTRPFAYINLNGKLLLYALKDCADQLRKLHNVSIQIVDRVRIEDVYVVKAKAILPSGREDESTGAVSVGNLKGDHLANALMKAETKAKRRVTLSVCGLGMLDESELETIPSAAPVPPIRKVEPKTLPSSEDPKALPAGETVSDKQRFSDIVQKWSGTGDVDLIAARNDAAKKYGHKTAKGLTEEQYCTLADALEDLMESGLAWADWIAQKQAAA